jgi:hypothetical protein
MGPPCDAIHHSIRFVIFRGGSSGIRVGFSKPSGILCRASGQGLGTATETPEVEKGFCLDLAGFGWIWLG